MWSPLILLCFLLLTHAQPKDDNITSLPGVNFDLNYQQYSGYLDLANGHHLHYWLTLSQNKPYPNDEKKIEKGNIKLWMAGSEQYKRKERAYFDGRANELLNRGFAYKTLTFEIFGGFCYEIKNLLDYFIELKEDDTDKIWKELSIYNMKLIAKRVLSKYKTYI